MKTSETLNEIAPALAKAQGEMKPAVKNATNPHFRSKFADLTSIGEAIREPLHNNGLSVIQETLTLPEGVGVVTRIIHQSGQWIECGPLIVPLGRKDAHGIGSATSYAKRYSLSAALGVVSDEDDDGNAAVKDAAKASAQQIKKMQEALEHVPTYKTQVMSQLEKDYGAADLSLVPSNLVDTILDSARNVYAQQSQGGAT